MSWLLGSQSVPTCLGAKPAGVHTLNDYRMTLIFQMPEALNVRVNVVHSCSYNLD